MKRSLLVAAFLLWSPSGNAAPAPERVAPKAFRLWSPREGPAAWVSDGVHVAIAPAPCNTPPQTEGCRFDPQNNQAAITVTAPGAAPLRFLTDGDASFYRIAVARFVRSDRRAGLVIENQSGGSGGDVRVQLLIPDHDRYRIAYLPGALQGELKSPLRDVSGDGRIDFVLGDGRFGYVFGCGACTPRPPRVFTLRGGRPVDVSRERAYAAIFSAERARLAPGCFGARANPDGRNGACAAYAASAAREGRFAAAWARIARQGGYDERALWQRCDVPYAARTNGRCPPGQGSAYRTFPESLRAFLRFTGYL